MNRPEQRGGLKPADKRDPVVARMVRRWRQLAGGEPGVLACSGGADSSALVLALASAGTGFVVAHVVHDLRPPEQALADRDAARALAEGLGLVFAERAVAVRGVRAAGGNVEAAARLARYAALAEVARERGLRFIATGHHADDQLETVLMRLLRGAGPRGLRGIAARRKVDGGEPCVRVVRPMLPATAEDARRLCAACGWAWREDATNADPARLRNRLRQTVLPAVRAIEPRAGERAVRLGRVMGEVSAWIEAEAARLVERGRADDDAGTWRWRVAVLAERPAAVVGAALRRASREAGGGGRGGLDRRLTEAVARAVRAAASGRGADRRWDWPGGVRVELSGEWVVLEKG